MITVTVPSNAASKSFLKAFEIMIGSVKVLCHFYVDRMIISLKLIKLIVYSQDYTRFKLIYQIEIIINSSSLSTLTIGLVDHICIQLLSISVICHHLLSL